MKKRGKTGWALPGIAASPRVSKAARVTVDQVLRIEPGERVLVVTNPEPDVWTISAALAAAAAARGASVSLLLQERRTSLQRAEDAVIHAMRSEPEVIVSVSAEKLGKDRFGLEKPYRFPGVKGAWDHIFNGLLGARRCRALWAPSITLDMFGRTVPVDYALMAARAARLRKALNAADRIHVASLGGTDIEIGVRGRRAFADDGDFSRPGKGGNLPAGEVYISPALGDAEGLLVLDGSLSLADGSGAFVPRKPVLLEVRGGFVVRLDGGAGARRFERSLALGEEAARGMAGKPGWSRAKVLRYAQGARHLGELGIGLNPAARVTGNMLEDEKILGTCHVALGANYDEDGPAFTHLDCVVQKPTITALDRRGRRTPLMERGRLL